MQRSPLATSRPASVSGSKLAACALTILALPNVAAAATFTVTSTADVHDGSPGNGLCATAPNSGPCTLRAAIEEANANPGFPADQINLPSGSYVLTLGELRISASLSLRGQSAATTIIDANQGSRVIRVLSSGTDPNVTIDNVQIRNGRPADFDGGGGILVAGDGIFVSLSNSIVSGNESDVFGAGIRNFGTLSIVNSAIRDNEITGDQGGGGVTATGGGIYNSSGATTRITRSTVSGNQATRAGGINNNGHVEIVNSTISGNRAFGGGGGIRNVTVSPPVFQSGTIFIAFRTITQNQANLGAPGDEPETRTGGGILNWGTVSIGNSILAENSDNRGSANALFSPDCFSRTDQLDGTFTSFRRNVVGVINANCNMRDTIFGNTAFDQVGSAGSALDPQLGVLTNNGGPTLTHALLSNSPAIGEGTGVTSATFFDCPATDQRGRSRPVNFSDDSLADCDAGAYEFGAVAPSNVNSSFSASVTSNVLQRGEHPEWPGGNLLHHGDVHEYRRHSFAEPILSSGRAHGRQCAHQRYGWAGRRRRAVDGRCWRRSTAGPWRECRGRIQNRPADGGAIQLRRRCLG